MNPQCADCGFNFDRGAGFWLGAIYVNYGLIAVIVTGGYFALFFADIVPQEAVLWLLTGFTVLFPLWLFPYGRSFWLGLDLYFDPQQTGESRHRGHARPAANQTSTSSADSEGARSS